MGRAHSLLATHRLQCPQPGADQDETGGRAGTEVSVVDRIIDHLKLEFVAAKPPPSHVFEQVALMAAEERAEYF